MDWLEQSVEQNLDDIFGMIGVNTYMRETEKQATSLPDTPLPADELHRRNALAIGAVGAIAPLALAGYGAMTSPEGRRMHGAASTVTRLPFLGAGMLGGLGLGAAAGLPLGAAIEPHSRLLAGLVARGLPLAGGLVGLRLGDYLGKAMAPGPRELGLGDVEYAKKEEKQAGVFTSAMPEPLALHLISGKGQSAPAAVQTHRPTWLGKMVGYADPAAAVSDVSDDAISQGLPNAAETNAEFASLLTSLYPEYFRGLDNAVGFGPDVSDARRRAAVSPLLTQAGEVGQYHSRGVESVPEEKQAFSLSDVTPYVNSAVDWAKANPMLAAGLGGAGVGGLGMLAANAMNPDEDERNMPLAALQGAALGGGLGLGGAALYNYAPKLLEGLKTTPETQAITDQIEAAERAHGNTAKRLFNNYVVDPAAYTAAGVANGVASPLVQAVQQAANYDPRALPSTAGAAAIYAAPSIAGIGARHALAADRISPNVADYQHGAQRILDYRPSGDKLTMWDSIRGLFGGNRPPELRSSKELQPFLEGLASKRQGFDAPAIRDMIAGARAGKTMDVRPGNLGVRMGGASHTMQSPITPQQFAAIGASAPRARLRAAGRGILPGLGLGLAGLATQRLFQSPAPAAPPTASP